ncbi:YLP motif-containing protein 1 isoform X2 [Dendropsophus ebraccatus]|uniref:YLP motif-containing protein 1 isoform X2 n=1 Tax=Dendropsophus ebraccatus TaxID=150705 RepID=UPI003831C3F1
MFPGWPPRYGGSPAPPTPAAPPPVPAFQSLRDQHLAQLEQLQRMHQRQLESVLPAGAPVASAPPPRHYYAPPRPPAAAYPFPPPPYGHSVPPPDYQQPPPPPEPEQPPPPPAPAEQPPPPPPPAEDVQPERNSGSLEPGMNLTEDPEQAQRLRTLQEAAAHWQQHEQHRLGFQYQGIIQKHSALQQLLQRYQQLLAEPPHLNAMSVEVQLQHYEVQQKQFLPLLQEWENQFKKWQELLQTYPHKDQLQDYHVQWTSWQTHMKATKTQLKDKVASLKNLKQQYGGNHYIAVVPQYPSYSPVLPPPVPAAAAPPGITVPPPFPSPGPAVYSTVPPPPLPTVMAPSYPEAAPPPLPSVSAPPLPPVTTAPPPPPPASTDLVEAEPPPLPPSNTGSSEAAATPPQMLDNAPPAEVKPSSPQLVAFTGSSGPPVEADTPEDKSVPPGLTYQAQQALKNAKASSLNPPAKNTPSVPSHQRASELPTTHLDSQSSEKHPDTQDVDSKPSVFSAGLSSVPEKVLAPPVPPTSQAMTLPGPRFPGSQASRFHAPQGGQLDGPRGPLSFRAPRPFHDGKYFHSSGLRPDTFPGQNQHFSKEQHSESVLDPADGGKDLPSVEHGVHLQTPHQQPWRAEENKWEKGELHRKKWDEHHVPANRWDQPEEALPQTWDRSSAPPQRSWDNSGRDKWDAKDSPFTSMAIRSDGQPQDNMDIGETHKSSPDRQGVSRTEAFPRDIIDKQESAQFDRLDSRRDPGDNTWGDPPDNNWGGLDPQHDEWSGPDRGLQDRWSTADNTPDCFGDAGRPGSDRVRHREGPLDRFNAHEVPFHAPNRFRFGAPDMPPRGRARFPGGPTPGRFVGPEGFYRERFDNPEGFARDWFGGAEGGRRDQFSSPEDRPRDLNEGPNFPPPRNRFGGPKLPPERYRGPEFSPNTDQCGPVGGSRNNWGFSEELDRFDNVQDSWAGNRAPGIKRAGRQEWHSGAEMMEGQPPVPMEVPINKDLHVDAEWKRPRDPTAGEQWGKFVFSPDNQKSRPSLPHDSAADKETPLPDVAIKTDEQMAPKTGTFHSRFSAAGKQALKAPGAGKTVVEMDNTDKISSECFPNAENPSVAPQEVRPESPTGKKADDTTNSKPHSAQTDGKDLPGAETRTGTQAEATAPVGNAALLSGLKESPASSKVPVVSDKRLPAPEATKHNVPKVPPTNDAAQTPVKPNEIQVSSDNSAAPQPPTVKNDPLSFSAQSAPALNIRPGAPHNASPAMFGTRQAAPPVRPGAPHSAPPVRPGAPHSAPPVRPGAPHSAPPVRPGTPLVASPFRPALIQSAVPVRTGAPRGFPLVRSGAPRASPPVRPGAPLPPPPPARPGAPWASPSIRQGILQAAPPVRPGQVRGARPIRPGAPRMPPPGRPIDFQAPISDEFDVDKPENEDNEYEQPLGADPRAQQFFKRSDLKSMNEPQIQSDHDPVLERKPMSRMPGPDTYHGQMRPNFSEQDLDSVESHSHQDPTRIGNFRDYEMSEEPEYYSDDFPSQGPGRGGSFDPRFHHLSRGRSRGFVRDRLPPRPGSRDMIEIPSDRSFEPRDPYLEERPLLREDPDDLPKFDREAFRGEPRFFERERFLDPLLDDRRRDLPVDRPRNEAWERERYWRDREPEIARDLYFRDERLPLPIPPLPSDLDVRCDPWLRERSLEREGFYDRAERRYLFDSDVGRDFPRIPRDLDLPLRDRDWLPPRRSLSPHRPFSPVQSRPALPPLPPLEDYLNDRWRLDRDLADRDFRDRVELRIREYPDIPLWREERKRNEVLGNPDLEPKDDRWFPSERIMEERRNLLPAQPSIAQELLGLPGQTTVPQSESAAHGVVALSQRQHEIILKAAQELKMLREQKEQLDNLKNFLSDTNPSDPLKSVVDPQVEVLQRPLDALEKREEADVLSTRAPGGRGPAEHWDEDSFSGLWDEERQAAHAANLPVGSKLSGIQQTVDYAHGRDVTMGKVVEKTPYGERVVLLPEPAALDRGISFPKDYLIDCYDRDLRDRDPYYERQSSKHLERRGYERERERDRSDTHRDRGDHDRERYERDRHSREDRSSSSSYRDKENSARRSCSDKPSYERKPERSSYEAAPPAFGATRRTYPEDRPAVPPPVSAPQPEKKPETKNVDDLLKKPGRASRPDRIVVIMRGLPGSGKTHVAKLIRDKEVECGGSAPRVLSLDDYFMTEVEKVEKDPESGKKVIRKVMEYEYEPEMEDSYRSGMLKTFKKTLDDGFFPFIILDSVHDRVRHFEQFWSAAKTKGFEVYLAEIVADLQTCAKRNVHGRKLKEINKMADNWEGAPRHMIRLDIRSLLQDAAIEEVEMEDSEPSAEPEKDVKKEALEEEESERGYLPKSKWEMDTSEAKLDKLDGLKTRKRDWESMAGCMEDYLQLPDDYDSRESAPGKKRVRWADLEEKKDADRKRAIGFIVGQTDWEKITDKSGHLAERALNRTKYI